MKEFLCFKTFYHLKYCAVTFLHWLISINYPHILTLDAQLDRQAEQLLRESEVGTNSRRLESSDIYYHTVYKIPSSLPFGFILPLCSALYSTLLFKFQLIS